MIASTTTRISGSFRDPSGFMFNHEGRLLRQVNHLYQSNYDLLMSSGLYEELTSKRLLVPHEEVSSQAVSGEAYKVLAPEVIPFISYPYEWSFSQLKDAALTTLRIQKLALKHGMSLKDASAYNIQFSNSRAILIDTLSFEAYEDGKPWVAYRQFCQHFLASLALMSTRDVRLNAILRDFIDGVPLELASALLPFRSRLNFGLLTHIHLHASAQKRSSGDNKADQQRAAKLSKQQLTTLIENLDATLRKLDWKPDSTAWADYYSGDSYSDAGSQHKLNLVRDFLAETGTGKVLDLGANTGRFSRIASEARRTTISSDFDPGAVEINYQQAKKDKDAHLFPIVLDLTNPSPALGWASTERDSFIERAQVDCVLALALIHHLAISNNVPLIHVAEFFASLAEWLIVEFVPKSDPKVQTLLATREDIFPHYTEQGFEAAFGEIYTIVRSEPIAESDRRLYLMKMRTRARPTAH
jgi:SAM-dependent methyltransferase